MELFNPDVGLAFWMLISFGLVVVLLAKYAWPAIIGGIHEREKFISESLTSAEEAVERLRNIKIEGDAIIAKAREEQVHTLQEGKYLRDKMVAEARDLAKAEAAKVMETARLSIQKEKEEALREIHSQVAILSLQIAEKVLRKDLDRKDEQMDLVNRLLDEINVSNK